MKKNKLNFIIICFALVCGAFFVNMSDAEAKGYAYCVYQYNESGSANSTGHTGEGVQTSYSYPYTVGFVAYDKLTVKTKLICGREDGDCSIYKQDNLEGGLNKYYWSDWHGWEECPSEIWLDYDGWGVENPHSVNLSTNGGALFDDFNRKATLKESGGSKDGSYKDGLAKLEKMKGDSAYTDTSYIGNGVAPPGVNDGSNANGADNLSIDQIKGGTKKTGGTDEGAIGACSLISAEFLSLLKNFFIIIQVIGVILMIILTMIDFVKALTASSDDGLSGAFKNTIKRIIATVILLVLPMIIIWVINIVNDSYTDNHTKIGGDGNPICIQ